MSYDHRTTEAAVPRDKSARLVLHNSLANLAGSGLGMAMPLLFNIAYLHLLGPKGFGLLGLFTTLLLASSIADFGITRAITRQFSLFSHTGANLVPFRRIHLWLFLAFGACLAAAVAVSGIVIGFLNDGTYSRAARDIGVDDWVLPLIGVIVVIQQLRSISIGVLNGLERQVLANSLLIAAVAARGLISVAVLVASGGDIEAFFIAQAASAAIETAFIYWRTRSTLPPPNSEHAAVLPFMRSVGSIALRDGPNVVIGAVIIAIDKLVLSSVLSLESFGIYTLLSQLAWATIRVSGAIVTACLPRFSAFYSQKAGGDLRRLYLRTTIVSTTLISGISYVIIALAGTWLELILPASSMQPWTQSVLMLLIVGAWANSLQHLPHSLLLASGRPGAAIPFSLSFVTIYAILLAALVPSYGARGAAIAWAIANIVQLPVFIAVAHRLSGLPGLARSWLSAAWPILLIPGPFAAVCAMLDRDGLAVSGSWLSIMLCVVTMTGVVLSAGWLAWSRQPSLSQTPEPFMR